MIWLPTIASVVVRLKKNEVWKMEIRKLDQINARNGRLCKNVQLSRSKATAVTEKKPNEDMISVM